MSTSVFVVLRVNPHPEEVICLRWEKMDAEERKNQQQLLYSASTYEVVEWYVH